MELALEALGVSEKGVDGTEAPLHLSFDIDSIDPKVCSSMTFLEAAVHANVVVRLQTRWRLHRYLCRVSCGRRGWVCLRPSCERFHR